MANGKLEADSDDDSDSADCSAQRWLASRLVSPITGMAPAFGAGALANWGKRTKETEEGRHVDEDGRPAKKKKDKDKDKKQKKKKKKLNG